MRRAASWCKTSKIIHSAHYLPSFLTSSRSSLMLSLLIWTPLATSLLSLPEAGNSHNRRPRLPSIAGGGGVWLDWLWMLSSSGSLSAAGKQRMLLPTSKAPPQQAGGQEPECGYLWGPLKLHIERSVVNRGSLSEITQSLLGFEGGGTVKQTKRFPMDFRSSWKSCSVGLSMWADKPSRDVHQIMMHVLLRC